MTDNELKIIELDKTIRENEIARQINEKRRIENMQHFLSYFDDSLEAIVEDIKAENQKNTMEFAKRAIVFDSISEMISCNNLPVDTTVRVNGSKKIGDNDMGWYHISSEGEPDGTDCIQLSNGLYAHLIEKIDDRDKDTIIKSSTSGSSKYFKLIVDDFGEISATPVNI